MAPIGPAGSSCLSIAIAWRRAVVCCPYALLIEPKEEEPGYKSYEHPTKNWGSAHLLNGIPDAASNGEFSVPPHPTRATEAHLISSPFFFVCVLFPSSPRCVFQRHHKSQPSNPLLRPAINNRPGWLVAAAAAPQCGAHTSFRQKLMGG